MAPVALRQKALAGLLAEAATWALLLLPGALVVYLGFTSGGFYPGATGVAAAALALAAALRAIASARPFEGLGPAGVLVAAALALLAALILVSSAWSEAAARSLLEYDRALLYLLAFVVVGSVAGTPARGRLVAVGIAAGAAATCSSGFLSRTLPDVFPVRLGFDAGRLSHPLDYWNSLGLLAAVATLLCLHLSSDSAGPRPLRVAGAALVPMLTATLLLTFSRGALVAVVIGALAYVAAVRSRALLAGLGAPLICSVPGVVAVLGADLLGGDRPTTAAATAQGHRVALWVLAASLVAGALRLLLLPLDAATAASPRRRRRLGRRVVTLATAAAVSGALLVSAALGVPSVAADAYDRFVDDSVIPTSGPRQERLTKLSGNGRAEMWRVAIESFADRRLLGHGAGTYQLLWSQRRDGDGHVLDAHSLYFETLAELGVVGLLLLAVAVGTLLFATALRSRRPGRALPAAALATGLAWATQAAVDWTWEVPAITVPVLALCAAALAKPAGSSPVWPRGRLTRVVVALGFLVLAVTPLQVAYSQAKLNQSVDAFRGRACERAVDAALTSIRAIGSRPEPYQLLSFCDVRLGQNRLAVEMAERAVARDPRNWEFRYTLALARASAGQDPRPAAREALRLNPRETLARDAVAMFRTDNPRAWKRRALGAPLPLSR